MNASFQCNEAGYSKLSEQLSWQPENFYEYYQMTPDTFTVKSLHKIRNEALFHAKKKLIETSSNIAQFVRILRFQCHHLHRFIQVCSNRTCSVDFARTGLRK